MDASWLYVESKDTPMHVAGLMIFELPKGAPLSYFQDLFKDSREHQQFYAPWNRKLRSSRLKNLRHEWVEEKDVDLDYHVRLSALPWPGGERELGILIARLHSRPLNFRRPPWECHVIQGLEHNRFALYIKMHHALIDGVSGMRLLARMLAKTPEDHELPAFWSVPPEKRAPTASLTSAADAVGGLVAGLRQKFSSVPELARATRELLRAARSKTDPMGVPFKAPKSMLNGRITGQRRFATQLYSIERVKKLAKAADCSLNDVVLALCGAALRRFLEEAGELPAQPLTAGIPVSVRPADDQEQGNAISFIISTLGTDIVDPVERLQAIRASTQRAKAHLQSLPKSALESYTMLLMGPYILQLLSGLGGRTRPVFNVTVSNVPGPQQPLYLRGAKLVANYPVSLVTHGQAINITCHGYADTLSFGFVACRDTLPHMQRIAVYTGEALEELETAVYGAAKPRRG
ncbi:wax ester/triacylglycerol synthase family O-acyltransferase [Solimonas sp. K1W22B-7]|nr:wax ester/triacylglycerol synthase family O-acyltransferase [Solimonas sp. K1W22B-7]